MKRLSYQNRIIIIGLVFIIASNMILGNLLLRQSRDALKSQIDIMMLDIVNTAADLLDSNDLDAIHADKERNPQYTRILHTLSVFKENSSFEFIYVARETANGDFIMVLDPATYNRSPYGEVIAKTDALVKAGDGVPAVDDKPYTDSYGRFYSAYSPVFSSGGRVAGVVALDIDADWYEHQINKDRSIILLVCIMTSLIGLLILLYMTRNYRNQIRKIKKGLLDLEADLDSITGVSEDDNKSEDRMSSDGIDDIDGFISAMHEELHGHINDATTQANSMITAMASDYRCVYHINLDKNDGVCYLGDPHDDEHTPPGIHFPYLERFTWYAQNRVDEKYREGFLRFIDPDNVRESLAVKPIIAYRYLGWPRIL